MEFGIKKKRKIQYCFFAVVCVFLLTSVFYTKSYADSSTPEDTSYFKGRGTEFDPYKISSYEELCALRDLVNQGEPFAGIYFKQTENIVFPEGEMWQPIGKLEDQIVFSGCYDGNGHTISNIHSETKYAGLFSFLDGEVRNLGIESGSFYGSYSGSITNHGTGNAEIINCYNKASVTGSARAGGIADNCPGLVAFCWNLGSVSSTAAGGVSAGLCSYGTTNISYCYAVGTDKLVDSTTFFGKISDSFLVPTSEISQYMEKMYQGMWENYSLKNETSLITENSTVFMQWKDNTLQFNKEYKPEPFNSEKEKNQEEFLSTYDKRFSFDGKGTEKDPFLINSYEDLEKMRDCVDIGVTYKGYYFQQTADIYFPSGENWEPIGDVSQSISFEGNYDGNGYALYDVYCKDKYAGLFAQLNGEVKNLGIESGCFTGSCCGSVTSHGSEEGKILNCYNKADVVATERAGGLTDNFGGKIILSWNLGGVSGENVDTVQAGICSYGNAQIEYSYFVGAENIVDSSTFTGTAINSKTILPDNLEEALEQSYSQYIQCIEDGTISPGSLIFLTMKDKQLTYDRNFTPKQVSRASVIYWIPLGVILAVGGLFIFAGLLVLAPKKSNQEAPKEMELPAQHPSDQKKQSRDVLHRRVFSIVLTGVALIMPFMAINSILINKNEDGIITMQDYYQQPKGCVDVLLVGSSKVGVNIDGEVLWNEYGISAYALWGSAQPFWNSYYYLEEAFRVNKPKVVVLDAVAASRTQEYFPSYQKLSNTLAIANLKTKLGTVAASCEQEEWLEFLLGFPLYHNRYTELTKEDFTNFPWKENEQNNKGFSVRYGFYTENPFGLYNINGYIAPTAKEEYYLNEIIQLCKEEDVNLVLVKTQELKCNQGYYNALEMIAENNQIPFINFEEMQEELDFGTDDFYADTHLNTTGSRKDSAWLGNFLQEEYNLEDHRGDERYHSWDIMACNLQNAYLRKIETTEDYFAELLRDGKNVLVLPYRLQNPETEQYEPFLDQLNTVPHDWLDRGDDLYGEENAISLNLGENAVQIEKGYTQLSIEINGESITTDQAGYLVFVYDEVTDTMGDVCLFAKDENFTPEHLYSITEKTEEGSESDSE